MKKPVIEGGVRPFGYIPAYYDPERMVMWAYPWPIAIPIRIYKRIKDKLLFLQPSRLDLIIDDYYNKGFEDGYAKGVESVQKDW